MLWCGDGLIKLNQFLPYQLVNLFYSTSKDKMAPEKTIQGIRG